MSSLAATDPTVTTFEATVTSCDPREDAYAVELDRTYFYPEGGGQPADRGAIAAQTVLDVQKTPDGEGGRVVHLVDGPVEPGAPVTCTVDEEYRTYCMRAHTASHLLYGAGRRLLDDLGYGGFGITDEKVRVDFTTSTDVADETLVELERLVNRAVWESRPVTWMELPAEEALALDRIAFNTKTEEGIEDDSVRVVTVGAADADGGPTGAIEDRAGVEDRAAIGLDDPDAEPWDVAACGGTHVSNTREIGPVTVLSRSNPGEGMTRVEFAVGPNAVEQRTAEKRVALDAARTLGTNLDGVVDEIDRLRDDRDALEAELTDLREGLVGARIAELRDATVERDGDTWLVGTVEGLDANGLADRASELAGDAADVVALVNGSSLAVGTTGDPAASDVVDDVTDEFGGGGGGSPTVAQGGGLSADDPADVVAFLRDR